MSEQAITGMEYEDFLALIDGFIERSSHEFGEMPPSSFFELLFEKMAERVTETVEVEGEIVNNQLEFCDGKGMMGKNGVKWSYPEIKGESHALTHRSVSQHRC